MPPIIAIEERKSKLKTEIDALSCGLPFDGPEKVLLAHGGGGRLMQQLIHGVFAKKFSNAYLDTEHDSAILPVQSGRIAFTTDSYVVRPLFFPGGDIGKLAVFGTVNDLAMSGARPQFLSVGVIIEEGFAITKLASIVESMQIAAEACGVQIVTGDTKVVERGKGDELFINTSGIGVIEHSLTIQPTSIKDGDAVILSGDMGRHGIAIMAARGGIEFETTVESDCAPLSDMILDLIKSGIEIHCLRDLTRGGLASALNEIATKSKLSISIDESHIVVQPQVRGACEMLGLDPLYVANEGRCVVFVPHHQAERTQDIMRRHEVGFNSSIIGSVKSSPASKVLITGAIGVNRILDLLSGEQLPRIC